MALYLGYFPLVKVDRHASSEQKLGHLFNE